jgi:protein-tyrosine-phosphatase
MKGYLSVIVLALAAFPVASQKSSSTVVFVCPHGAAKSVVAAAYFNKMSAERGLPYRAVARGTEPGEALSQTAIKGLVADGLPAPAGKPQAISNEELRSAARVVTLGCPLPPRVVAKKKHIDWNVGDVNQDYAAARDTIAGLVTKLLDSMAPAKRP